MPPTSSDVGSCLEMDRKSSGVSLLSSTSSNALLISSRPSLILESMMAKGMIRTAEKGGDPPTNIVGASDVQQCGHRLPLGTGYRRGRRWRRRALQRERILKITQTERCRREHLVPHSRRNVRRSQLVPKERFQPFGWSNGLGLSDSECARKGRRARRWRDPWWRGWGWGWGNSGQ